MSSPKTMAVPLSEWREQQARTDSIHRLVKMTGAAVCIIAAAAHWDTITSSISEMAPSASKQVQAKSIPVSSHRQGFGTTSNTPAKPGAILAPTAPKKSMAPIPVAKAPSTGPLERTNEMSKDAAKRADKTVATTAVGFHRNSKVYRAHPELEQRLLSDHGAQKEVAKMIASTYKVSYKTASLIVAKSVVEAKKHQIDPFLVLALMGQESSFNKQAESNYGAQGVMQVVPRFHEKNMKKVGVTDILEAPLGKQIELGTIVLKEFLGPDKKKPVEVALQHYNQGENAKIDPNLKYANGVLTKRGALTATVANYVQESAPTYASMKPNL